MVSPIHLPQNSSEVNFDAAFFRALASVSEVALLTTLQAIALKNDRLAIFALADFLEQDGFPLEGLLAGNVEVKITGTAKSTKASLSRSVLCAIQGHKGQSHADDEHRGRWDDVQCKENLALVERFVKLCPPGDASRNKLLNDLLFESCGIVYDARFAQGLMDLGANPSIFLPSMHPGISSAYWLETEAAIHGNAALIRVLATRLPAERKARLIEGYVLRYTHYSDDSSAPKGIALALHARPDHVIELLGTLDRHFSADEVAPLRARILSYYLGRGLNRGGSWSEDAIQAVMGAPGSPSYEAMTRAAALDANSVKTEANDGDPSPPWRELYRHELTNHCADVLGVFGKRLREENNFDYKKKEDPAFWAIDMPAAQGAQLNSSRFRATLDVLVAHGHRLDRAETGHPPAVHLVAKAKDAPSVRLQKLRVLLEMGLDPFQKSFAHSVASFHLKKEDREQWDLLARSYLARQHAMNALSDLPPPGP